MPEVVPERVQNDVDSKAWILYRALKIILLILNGPLASLPRAFSKRILILLMPDIES